MAVASPPRFSHSSPLQYSPHTRIRSPVIQLSFPIATRRTRRWGLLVRASEEPQPLQATKRGEAPPVEGGSSFNQLLGIKGAARETDISKIRLQLTKPVTWTPLVWGVVCGAAASGNFHWTLEDVIKSIICMFMSGPCLTGYAQTLNDWYDREIDAINEPYRPIPAGVITESEVISQIWLLLLAGLGTGALLDLWAGHTSPVVLYLALSGSLIAYIYSAPPLKLKRNGWIGNFTLGASYICFPWWAGQAVFGTITADAVFLTLFYSIAGLGIAIVNDFKSIEGDNSLGLQSLPVVFGIDSAKWICVGAIDVTQMSVASTQLFVIVYAVSLVLLLNNVASIFQVFLEKKCLPRLSVGRW